MTRNRAKPMERMRPIGVPGAAYRQVRGPLVREGAPCRGGCSSPDRLPWRNVASEPRQCNDVERALRGDGKGPIGARSRELRKVAPAIVLLLPIEVDAIAFESLAQLGVRQLPRPAA